MSERIKLGEHYEKDFPLIAARNYEFYFQHEDTIHCLHKTSSYNYSLSPMKRAFNLAMETKNRKLAEKTIELIKKRLEIEKEEFPRLEKEYFKKVEYIKNADPLAQQPPMMFGTSYYNCKEYIENASELIGELESILNDS